MYAGAQHRGTFDEAAARFAEGAEAIGYSGTQIRYLGRAARLIGVSVVVDPAAASWASLSSSMSTCITRM